MITIGYSEIKINTSSSIVPCNVTSFVALYYQYYQSRHQLYRMKIWIQYRFPVFHLAISNKALRHAVLHERHVALHERHVAYHLLKRHHAPFNYCQVQLKPTLVIVTD